MDYFVLILGVLAAGAGGELFVRGAVGLAAWIRIPAGIIGATVAAFATSSPEFAVSLSASLAGEPHIALGDALGSNVVNISLVLGVTLAMTPLFVSRESLRRDFLLALAAPVLTIVLILDAELSRWDALLMFSVFIAWLVVVVFEVHRERSRAVAVLSEVKRLQTIGAALAGLFLLVVAGRMIVSGAKSIASSYGLEEFTIGATVVAVGTSVPELATVLVSKFRGHEEIGLGTILGSNIFNNLWIVSVAAMVTPMSDLPLREIAVGIGFGITTVVVAFPPLGGTISRWRGMMLLLLYIFYVLVLLRG